MMMIIMLGMGASMTPRDFRIAFASRRASWWACCASSRSCPSWAIALAVALGLPPRWWSG
jgi:predicted Na+-dependent transporter